MPFPESERVLYDRPTLVEVICQLRFPPVLRIESETPAKFQEHIRAAFPQFEEESALPVVPPELPPDLGRLIARFVSTQATRRVWRFRTEDGHWTVGLSREFLSLSTDTYLRWEDFRGRLVHLLDALTAEYQPAYLSRAGLRYRNLIVRSKLDLPDAAWAELLAPHIASERAEPRVAAAVENCAHQVVIALAEGRGKVTLRHGTTQQGSEECYALDSDLYREERTEATDVLRYLDGFNKRAARLFRWCISERLHDAMRPGPVPSREAND